MSEWGKTIGTLLGGTVAGPFGALIGGILGTAIEVVTPFGKEITADVLVGLSADGLKQLAMQGYQHFQTPEAIQVNHDLQKAFRDALREAIYDIGGPDCFAKQWSQARRQSPQEVRYPIAALRHRDKVLADQVCASLNALSNAVDSLLPLTAPLAAPTSIEPYLLGNQSDDLERGFWQEVVQPYLARNPIAPEVAAAYEQHLRLHLFPRTLVHLGENLKERPQAWRAFNRLLLETMQQTLAEAAANDVTILQDLAAIRAQLANLEAPDSEQLADLISELGETRRHQDERFDQLLNRVVRQHREVLGAIGGVQASVLEAERRLSQKIAELATIQVISSEIQDLPPLAGEAPYKGLLAYEQADEAIYFGRSELAGTVVQNLREHNFVAVVGGSGSGKSSLVGAGILPLLARQGWRIFEMTPTTQPLDKLSQTLYPQNSAQRQRFRQEVKEDANALAQAGTRLAASTPARRALLVVDQFEELFTLAHHEAEDAPEDAPEEEAANRAFVDALLAVRSNRAFAVVIVLRSDFYHRCADYEGLFSAVAESQVALEPLSNRQLLDVIGQPLLRNQWRIQEGLAQTILEDVGREVGGLPFLAHALRETWERRRHNVLTLSGYHEAGGVKGAITESAEAAWHTFSPQEQSAARTILLELTELGEREGDQLHTPDTRRRRTYAALAQLSIATSTLDSVLEELVHRRLLIRDQEHIEVAHEALIRAWPRLQAWLSADHARLRVERQIEGEASNWVQHGRDASYLARGARLAQASEWAASQPHFPSGTVGEFLHASIEAEEFERNREVEQAQALAAAQSRRARTFRWAAILTTLLSVIAIVAALWALNRQSAAVESAEAASNSAVQAQAESTRASQAAESANMARATADANAAEAQNARATAEANAAEAEIAQAQAEEAASTAQSRALAAAAQAEASKDPMRAWLLAIEAGQTAETEQAFAAINEQASVMAQLMATLDHNDIVNGSLWNKDGSRILTWGNDNFAKLWEAESGTMIHTFEHAAPVEGAAWNEDESRLFSWDSDGTINIWDAESGDLISSFAHPLLTGAAWNPDGRRLLTWSIDFDTIIWDSENGEVIHTLDLDWSNVNGAAWSNDGSRVLSWGTDNTARIWNAESGKLLHTLDHDDSVDGALWNADDSRILTWSNDNTARVWDANRGEMLFKLEHDTAVLEAAWNDDESRILTRSEESPIRLWDAEGGDFLLTLAQNVAGLGALWNQDGSRILSWGEEHSARVYDSNNGLPLLTLGHDDVVEGAAWNQDASRILTWSRDKSARVWDATSGELLLVLSHDDEVNGAAWSDDERRLLSWSWDNSARVWDAESGALPRTLVHEGAVIGSVWNDDESRILSWGEENSARVWDAKSGNLLFSLVHADDVIGALWNKDESRILTWSWDNSARVWDAASGEELFKLEHDDYVADAAWNEDESRILTRGDDENVRVWAAATGEFLHAFDFDTLVQGAVWNKDGTLILSWSARPFSDEGSARVLDAESGEMLLELKHDSNVAGALWNNDESRILSWGGSDAYLWDVKDSSRWQFKLSHDIDGVLGAAWSGDESRILTWGLDYSARVWDAESGKQLLKLANGDIVEGAAWNEDETRILTWGDDKRVHLWDCASGEELFTLLHDDFVYEAMWNKDESIILSWGEDNSVRLWDAESGERMRTIASDSFINSVQWNSSEEQIMLATEAGGIYRYYTSMAELIQAACTRATRNLTLDEWQQVLPDEDYRLTCPNLPAPAPTSIQISTPQ